jgi:hypothetical protein
MEPFEINLVGETLRVEPQADETLDIFRGETKWTTLIPETDPVTGGTQWETPDLIASDYVKQMGELIEKHEM